MELRKIINKDFDIQRLQTVRDIFIFCCFTGLAFTDVKNLKKEHLVQADNGEWWIRKVSNLRIKYAINQLKEHPNYTIQAIADESGFSNLRSFQRIFKAQTGMTPSEYKTAIEQTDF